MLDFFASSSDQLHPSPSLRPSSQPPPPPLARAHLVLFPLPTPPFSPLFPPPDIYMLNPPSYTPLSPPKNIRKTPPPSLVNLPSVTEVPLVMLEPCPKQPLLRKALETMSIVDRTGQGKQGKHREVQQTPRTSAKYTIHRSEKAIRPSKAARSYGRDDTPAAIRGL